MVGVVAPTGVVAPEYFYFALPALTVAGYPFASLYHTLLVFVRLVLPSWRCAHGGDVVGELPLLSR